MLPGLSPMFLLEFSGPQTRRLRYVTPDEDITLDFHCHVPGHEKMGMFGQLVVGRGGEKVAAATVEAAATEKAGQIYDTTKQVIAISRERGITTAEAADAVAEARLQQGHSP